MARRAFREALQLGAATSAAVAVGVAMLSAALLPRSAPGLGAEREPRPGLELDEEIAGGGDGDDVPGPVATAAGRPERGQQVD